MKRKIMTLMAVLLICTAAIALKTLPETMAIITITLESNPTEAGYITFNNSKIATKQYYSERELEFAAVANPGYQFESWYVDGEFESNENPHTFTTTTSNMTIVAKFTSLPANILKLKVKEDCGSMGTVSYRTTGTNVDGGQKYTTGTEVTIAATANKGYKFECWEDGMGASVSTDASYTFTINSDMILYAVFSPLDNYNPELVSFPGADGYGRFTTGGRMIDGRGSKVYYVTRLDDTGEEGTFRWAATTGDDTPRTILFKVAGTIYITSRFSVKPNTTIAGQTAPGGGVCLAGYQLKLQSNTIVRHIRFRAGDLPNKSMSMLDVENVKNIVLDHCTFSWSMEENLTMYDCDYTTVQWCIFSEGLYDSRNTKGARSYAAQWGGEHGTMHHCLIANCNNRTPRFNGVRASTNDRHVDNEFVNNVIFNWGKPNSLYGGENDKSCNGYNRTYMINNYFRPGPTTRNNTSSNRYFVGASNSNGVGQWYLSGNKFETGSKWAPSTKIWSDEVLEKVNADNLHGFINNSSERAVNLESVGQSQATYDTYILQEPVEWSGLTYESADEAYEKVVTQAGASLPRYDEVDARILAEAAGEIDPQFAGRTESGSFSRGMGIINSPKDITLKDHDVFAALYEGDNAEDNQEIDVTCYPRLQPEAKDYACQVVDTDGDGLPDAYETEVGLNPNDSSDGAALTTSGYSNLELFLNGVADRQIDATKYTQHQSTSTFTGFNATVEPNSAGDTTPIQAAINAAPDDATPYYIFIKKGVYFGHVVINRANIHLVGQGKDNTVITWNKLHTEDGGNVNTNATVNVTANDVSFDDLTIRNTRVKEGQALALYTNADRICITQCNLEGYQDTYRTGNKDKYRHIVRNCKISGRTDFIYGTGEVFFDSDTLCIVESGGWIVAPAQEGGAKYGYVFRDNIITAKTPGLTTYLGRPWKEKPIVSFINTRLTEGVSIYPAGWSDMGGLPIQMAEYNTMDASGNVVDLSQRKTQFTGEGGSCTSKAILGKVESDSYQLDYMLRGTDNWDADWQAFILPAPKLTKNGSTLKWVDETGFAQCYLIVKGGVATITQDTSCKYADDITVQCISAFGVTGEVAKATDAVTGIKAVVNNVPVAKRQYFTPDGRQVNRLQHGVTMICDTLTDGSTRTTKVMSK